MVLTLEGHESNEHEALGTEGRVPNATCPPQNPPVNVTVRFDSVAVGERERLRPPHDEGFRIPSCSGGALARLRKNYIWCTPSFAQAVPSRGGDPVRR